MYSSNLFFVALSIFWSFGGVQSECPNINDLPVLNDNGTKFFCAWIWPEWGDPEPIRGCNGLGEFVMDEYDSQNPPYMYTCFGSLIVKAGCLLYGYDEPDYNGHVTKYYGPGSFPDTCTGQNCPWIGGTDILAHGYMSFQCRCDQEPIICQPSDEWNTIMQCDNTLSSVETLCSYTKTIGTTYTTTVQNSMSIDVTIEESMSTDFFRKFSAEIGVSATTGYDWTHISTEAKVKPKHLKSRQWFPQIHCCRFKELKATAGVIM